MARRVAGLEAAARARPADPSGFLWEARFRAADPRHDDLMARARAIADRHGERTSAPTALMTLAWHSGSAQAYLARGGDRSPPMPPLGDDPGAARALERDLYRAIRAYEGATGDERPWRRRAFAFRSVAL